MLYSQRLSLPIMIHSPSNVKKQLMGELARWKIRLYIIDLLRTQFVTQSCGNTMKVGFIFSKIPLWASMSEQFLRSFFIKI